MTTFIAPQPARQGDARDRAGPRRRAAHGHQRRHDDLPDLPARRHARRRRRPHLRAVPDDDLVLPGLHGRPDRVHRRGHGRHRQHQGAVLGGLIIGCIQQISDNRIGTEWTPADRVRLPDPDHGLPAVRACWARRRGRPDERRRQPRASAAPPPGAQPLAVGAGWASRSLASPLAIILPLFFDTERRLHGRRRPRRSPTW